MPSKVTTPWACPHCGREFFPYTHQVTRGKVLYCSRPCFNANFPTTAAETRFWLKVNKNGPLPERAPDLGPCWVWTGGVDGGGYGQFRLRSRVPMVKAHRLAWELIVGPVPDGLWVLHKCDNPPCCHPGHLFVGTPSDNARDAIAKGRHRNVKRPHVSLPGQAV
jgi:hypothetical protein